MTHNHWMLVIGIGSVVFIAITIGAWYGILTDYRHKDRRY